MATSTGPMAQAPGPHDSHTHDSPTSLRNEHSSRTDDILLEQDVPEQSVKHRTSHKAHKTRSALGLHPQAPIDEEHDFGPRSELLWSRIRTVLREPFAEFWGVAIMVMFGNGSVAQVLLSTNQATAPGGNGFGSYQSINWG